MLSLNGKALPGVLIPAEPGSPSLVLIHEYWGLNAHIRDVAGRFSKEGFTVFAVDLFGGEVATDEATASGLLAGLDRNASVETLCAAASALKAADPSTKIGIVGFCMGGGFALSAAAASGDFAACVPFYGIGAEKLDAAKIRAKVQGHFASHDDFVSPSRVDALEHNLKAANVDVEIHRYVADHAFFNDTRKEVYSEAAAALAWQRTVKFLKAALR